MDEQAKKAERIKALLSGYYGSAAGAKSQQGQAEGMGGAGRLHQNGSQGAQHASTAASLEAASQEARRHVAQMLRNSSLEQLLGEHRTTAKEIKNLESDIQQLVYENYSKFISATDTIRVMKARVDGAMPELHQLKTTMDVVADRSTAVGCKLQYRQQSMQELHRVQELLLKLQVVFDLPKRMRAALEEDVMDAAVGLYAEAQPLLKKFGHRGVLRQVASQAELVAKEIAQVLKRRMSERKDDTERCVLLLRKLGEPDRTLQDRYLAGRAQRVSRILKDGAAVADAMATAAAVWGAPADSAAARSATAIAVSTQGQLESPEGWGFGEGGAVPSLRAFITALDEKFINAVQETASNVTRFFLPQDLPEHAAAAKRKPLLALIRESFNEYFRIVRRVLADSIAVSVWRATHPTRNQAADAHDQEQQQQQQQHHFDAGLSGLECYDEWGVDELAQALSILSADLLTVSGSLPELELRKRAGEMVVGAVHRHVQQCFAGVEGRVMGALGHVVARMSAAGGAGGGVGAAGAAGSAEGQGLQLQQGFFHVSEVLGRCLVALMQGLRVYEGHTRLIASWNTPLSEHIQACLQSMFLHLLSSLLAAGGAPYDGSDATQEALRLRPALPVDEASIGSPGTDLTLWALSPSLPPAFAHQHLPHQHPREHPLPPPASPSVQPARTSSSTPASLPTPAAPRLLSPAYPAAALAQLSEAARPGLVLLLAKLCQHMQLHSMSWASQALANSALTAPATPQDVAAEHPYMLSCASTLGGVGSSSGSGRALGRAGSGSGGGMPHRGGVGFGSGSSGGGVGYAGYSPQGEAAPVPAFQPAELARCMSAACAVLLGVYADIHGRHMSIMVRRSVAATPWLHHKEPRAPRALCDLLVERVEAVEAEVCQLAEGGAPGALVRRGARAAPSSSATSHRNERGFGAGLLLETGNVERNLAKIFQERVKVFGQPLQLTQAALLGAVVGIALKSLLECIRLQTLGRAGLQQLQLDCHYLRPLLRCPGAREQQVIDTLLDEVVTAGVERAIDTALLEPLVLDRILSSVQQQQQQQQQQQ